MTNSTDALAINELPLFRGIEPAKIRRLIQGGVAVACKHRHSLFRAGEEAGSFFLVLMGAFKLFRHELSGRETIVHFAGPGDAIAGLVMAKPGAVYPVSACSIGRSMVLRLSREIWLQEWASNASLQQRISQDLFGRMSRIQEDKARQRHSLAQRVSSLILMLLDRFSNESQTVIPIPITRQELADSVGSTVESVIRLMSEWTQAGILSSSSRQIEVLKLDQLASIAHGQDAPET